MLIAREELVVATYTKRSKSYVDENRCKKKRQTEKKIRYR